MRMDLRGRNGVTIQEAWKEAPKSLFGVFAAEFPNLFMILGPLSIFSNIPPAIETQVEFIAEVIKYAEEKGFKTVEASVEAEKAWGDLCKQIADMTLFSKQESWIFSANIPGKRHAVNFFVGGLKNFRKNIAECREKGYEGLVFA